MLVSIIQLNFYFFFPVTFVFTFSQIRAHSFVLRFFTRKRKKKKGKEKRKRTRKLSSTHIVECHLNGYGAHYTSKENGPLKLHKKTQKTQRSCFGIFRLAHFWYFQSHIVSIFSLRFCCVLYRFDICLLRIYGVFLYN